MTSFYEQYRNGSASWCTLDEARDKGLASGRGFPVGNLGRVGLSVDDGHPIQITGGSGGGKFVSFIAPFMLTDPGRAFVCDLKGEITATTLLAQTRMGKHVYCINPFKLHGMANHNFNPVSHLHRGSPTLDVDIKGAAEALVVTTGSGNARFFEMQARSLLEAFKKFDAESQGVVSLPRIKQMVDTVLGDVGRWESLARAIIAMGDRNSIATIDLITSMQASGSRTFDSIMAEATNALAFLTIGAIRECVGGRPRFTLQSALCSSSQSAVVAMMIPADMVSVCEPFMRLTVNSAMTMKARSPSTPRVTFLLDEVNQLGRADFVPRAMNYMRGMGVNTVIAVQDRGVLRSLYGPDASETFQNSAGTQIYVAVRDGGLASDLSRALGNTTAYYTDGLQRERAAHAKREAIRAVMGGADVLSAVLEVRHQASAAEHRMSQPRALATQDEIRRLSAERAIVLTGRGCPALLLDPVPYYRQRRLAGWYGWNPHGPLHNAVEVQTWLGPRIRRMIEAPVPERYAHLAQHDDGRWSYVDGYRP